ncbi:MAG: cyclodeaminase/cyclohydrolase family protein [Candidatus Eremiobacteraeota bacterium]|nr:cyclodeaminase/cyclohydrolase family protein [Candidatus Eremiobacteraeota bacterium]MBV8355251.1 cyclodeaminase/cyclohydrolase family protein [Candidatus Eremiobacteraeota bacterium]
MLAFNEYMERLASSAPTPGGGSAAGLVAALGAALCAMVARIVAGGKVDAERAGTCRSIAGEADRLRNELLAKSGADEIAYGEVVAAMALPKATPEEKAIRDELLQQALTVAARIPLEIAQRAVAVVALADATLALENRNLISDVLCAGEFGGAALAASAANVRINHRYLRDATMVATQDGELAELERESQRLLARIRTHVNEVLLTSR